MKRLSFYLVAFALLPLSVAETGAEASLEAYGYRYRVQAILDGRVKARMIIDTGSSHTIITPKIARKLGITNLSKAPSIPLSSAGGVEWMRLVTLQSVTIGGHETKMVEGAVSSRLGRGVDGLLGMNFLGDYSHIIDGRQMKLVLKPAYETGELYGEKNQAWWRQRFSRYQRIIKKYTSIRDKLENGSPPMTAPVSKKGKTFTDKEIGAIIMYYKGLRAELARRAKALSMPLSWQNGR
ncbi:hypothetical protein MNBD_NITROSPINAE02-751 [hydrothermal vent metagenome]|uniref:Peptidase A2 domain-containing protein n=1 Tax=hydrothermal vent metagenome TaxID=652676 RepID=A0A3B1CT88_9ZZZZ